jgi:hypothetical protein
MLREPHLLQLVALFDFIEDVMAWVKDREGRFCWVNRANEHVLTLSRSS